MHQQGSQPARIQFVDDVLVITPVGHDLETPGPDQAATHVAGLRNECDGQQATAGWLIVQQLGIEGIEHIQAIHHFLDMVSSEKGAVFERLRDEYVDITAAIFDQLM